jgi:hypothetical protein
MWIPKTYPINSEIFSVDDPTWGTSTRIGDYQNGVVYTHSVGRILKTADYGVTPLTIVTDAIIEDRGSGLKPQLIYESRKLDSGRILAITSNNIWLSDENEANFTVVQALAGGANMAVQMGCHVFGDIILVCNYNNNPEAWISFDGGLNWNKVFDTSKIDIAVGHPHAIAYDPYEHLIWMSFGDAVGRRDQLAWSDNWGTTWEWIPTGMQRRITSIMPLPHCVLFGSDEHEWLGVYRLDRPAAGTHGSGIYPQKYWQARSQYTSTAGDMGWMTLPAMQYGENFAAYFGFWAGHNMLDIPTTSIYATKDGRRFFPIWNEQRFPNDPGANGAARIISVHGPHTDGTLVAGVIRYLSGAEKWQGVKISFPGWEWVDVEK